MTEIRSYQQANEYLGKKDSRPIRYKTRVERRSPTSIAIKHHNTDIITYCISYPHLCEHDKEVFREQIVIIDTQGFHTKTTKDRLNAHLPEGYYIYRQDSIWYLERRKQQRKGWKKRLYKNWVFADGMKIEFSYHPDGIVEGAGPPAKELKKLNKEILKYSRNYIKALFAGEVPKPGLGDCWNCALVVSNADGSMHAPDHLKSHFEEKYYVPSLLVRAIEVFPVSPAAKWALGDLWGEVNVHPGDIRILHFARVAEHQLRSSLRRYLRRQLGLAS